MDNSGIVIKRNAKKKNGHSIPCRIKDNENPDLFMMTLGKVKTGLSDGIFNPEKDSVTLNSGTKIQNYYKDVLKIKYFQPIDKSFHPLPPSGWCSWYYYYHEISADEVKKNAKWLSENLEQYGAKYCQVDDGWQGIGHGLGENRDWTTVDKRFSEGMDKLARHISRLGLLPGIWLAPHGQSNKEVIKKWDVFLFKKDGASASDTWVGNFLVDPTASGTPEYLRYLFTTLYKKWGYVYFKIDGQPIVIKEYKKNRSFMKKPAANSDEVYRDTLKTIRKTIGKESFLLGCWGIPLQGVGIMDGSRTGGDIILDWKGFLVALKATMSYYYLHNIAWYCDPDVIYLGHPLSLDMARAWATLQGLTGQILMVSGRLMDLPSGRIEIMKRIYPAVDIRPLDLFPAKRNKKIWDLKVNHLKREYDVIGCFNYDTEKTDVIYLNWEELGFLSNVKVHIYDFWNKEYLGCWEKGYFVHVSPTSCRVLTLVVDNGKPQLISTNRHITQGWVDLIHIDFNSRANIFTGKSQVIANDTYELRFVFPRVGRTFRIKKVQAGNLKAEVNNYQGWATVRFTSPISKEVSWKIVFESAEVYSFPLEEPREITIKAVGTKRLKLSWLPSYTLNAGYRVYYNGRLLGISPLSWVTLNNLNLSRGDYVEIATVWYDGSESKRELKQVK